VYGASAEAVPTTLEALWSEGLATFVSWRMNPGVSLDIALLQPGIPEGANPHLADIAKDLLAHLDDKDEATYRHYFVGGGQEPGYPPRAGYFVGTLVAQNLSALHATAVGAPQRREAACDGRQDAEEILGDSVMNCRPSIL
jgi:hypothetical protein